MNKELMDIAKSLIPEPDVLVNMNKMIILWMSQKALNVLEMPESKVIGKRAFFLSDLPLKESKKIAMKDTRIINNNLRDLPIKTKKTIILVTMKYSVFEDESVFYYVGEAINIKPLKKTSNLNNLNSS